MTPKRYFVINDTRFDNHHGGLRVMANLHLAMQRRGWQCTGSLPVSATTQYLNKHRAAIGAANLIVVNGEGSLHHNSRNTQRLYAILDSLHGSHPIVLINALWQDNDPVLWRPVLKQLDAVYARDRRSQAQLHGLDIDAGYAPDLTFYHYPDCAAGERTGYLCTDSVVRAWNERAYQYCSQDPEMVFATLLTRHLNFSRGPRDYSRRVKYALYPRLYRYLPVEIPARYKALAQAVDDNDAFIRSLAGYRGICAARYHALCFALQQKVPVVSVPSNSHKSEALLEEAGLPREQLTFDNARPDTSKQRLQTVETQYEHMRANVIEFNKRAVGAIDHMFDHITAVTH